MRDRHRITWAGPAGSCRRHGPRRRAPKGGVLVIHENKGLNDWVRSVAGRFAGHRLLGTGDRSALGAGRHGDIHRSRGGHRRAGQDRARGVHRQPEVRCRRVAAPSTGSEGRRRRLLHGRRAGVAAAGRRANHGWPPRSRSTDPCPTTPISPAPKMLRSSAFTAHWTTGSTPPSPSYRRRSRRPGVVHELVTEPDANHAFFNDTGDRYNASRRR